MYKAEILADSLSPQGDRLVTMKVTFPRIVLAEFNTHRMFSRNSASSRAIPFNKMVKMVEENPFIPIAWQKSHSGMQGTEYFTDKVVIELMNNRWLEAMNDSIYQAIHLNGMEVTKQLCNRLLEPFMWHTVIVTSSEEGLENFFKLRCPSYNAPYGIFKSKKDAIKADKFNFADVATFNSDSPNSLYFKNYTDLDWLSINKSQADIHIQAIAELMWDAYNESTPKQLKLDEWHIPFGDNIDNDKIGDILYPNIPLPNSFMDYSKEKIKIATARCARISYETLGDNPKIDYEADIRLHDMLVESGHWSPFEHCARAMSDKEYYSYVTGEGYNPSDDPANEEPVVYLSENEAGYCRNFRGFIQYRHLIEKP